MLREIDQFYLQKEEPVKSCLLALRDIILLQDINITLAWKYKMPFFCYKSKMFCYLWVNKKSNQPYIGIVEGKLINHPELIIEKRSRMKIMMTNANEDLPLETITSILQQALDLYRNGVVKIRR
ncbi:MAG: DUF1801 domain-containing protein [Panacibacter sp.]